MKKLDRETMENAIKASKLGAKADLLKSLHDNETESTRSPDAFGWHNIDDIERLEGLERNYFWAEDQYNAAEQSRRSWADSATAFGNSHGVIQPS